jgi:TPR repeat protein
LSYLLPKKCLYLALPLFVLSAFSVSSAFSQDEFGAKDQASIEAVESLNAAAAYKTGDYETARHGWLALADKGNTSAMLNLANLYAQGQGVEPDPAEAIRWLEKAAALGDSRAEFELGMAYERGIGVDRDPRAAAEWFRRAADQGDKEAQFNLAVMLATAYGAGLGESGPEQRAEAIAWLKKAAASGHPDASNLIATLEALN